MSSVFHQTRLVPDNLDITLDDLLDVIHEEDRSSDNPLVCEALQVLEQLPDIADVQGGFAVFDAVAQSSDMGGIYLSGELLNTSGKICRLMDGVDRMAVLVCTAGEGFTECSKEYNRSGEYLKGYLVDTLGSVVAEKAMDSIHGELERTMALDGLKVTNRYSPGYCNWPLDDQKKLFSLLPSGVCGITLSSSCLMKPIKSISGVVGIGLKVEKKDYSCDICTNKTCIYRKVKDKTIQH